ncbi:MAG TPA: sulfotransferase [Vicingus sp.]|nr:sulfotransferase [Vicingus sp.]
MLTIEEIEKIQFVFIVGRGRSGTTLLQTILDANKNAILPLESQLIIHLKQKYFKTKKWNNELIDELIIDLYKDKKFNRSWGINSKELTQRIKSYDFEKLSFSTICKLIYLSYPSPFEKGEIKLIGDKNPIFSIFIPDLLEVFPNAKFIHLIRDYRDNTVSNRESFVRKSIATIGNGWIAFNLFIEKNKSLLPKSFFTLKYESLVTEPEQKVKELCNFLSIDFNSNMLNFHQKIKVLHEEHNFEALNSIHANLVKPINTKQINKWQGKLSINEIELLDYICRDYASKYEYISTTNKSSILFYIKSLIGKLNYKKDFIVIKTYYKSPFIFRDLTGYISLHLYKWFKFSHYYNHADFRFNNDSLK